MNQKKKISRKVISYVLALVMVLSTMTGIVPGTGITAQAAAVNDITINRAEHGSVTANPTTAESGTTITLTAQPEVGYKLKSISAIPIISDNFTFTKRTTTCVGTYFNLTGTPYDGWYLYNGYDSGYLTISSKSESTNIDSVVLTLKFDLDGNVEVDHGNATANGKTITINNINATSVRITATENNYVLGATVYGTGEKLELTGTSDSNVYTFTMPDSAVSVSAEFEESPLIAQTVTAPTAASGLTYKKDQAQALLASGAVVTEGNKTTGSIKYKVGDEGTWSTDIPTGTNAGVYKVYYKVEGNDTYAEYAPTDPISVTIAKADPVTPTGITAKYYDNTGKIKLPDGWTWQNDWYYFENVGTVTCKADFAGDENYNAKTGVDITVEVGKADAAISYKKTEVSVEYNAEFGKNEITMSGDAEPTFKSSNESVATVSNSGYVTIKGLGETTITATVEDNAHYHYTTKEASYKLTVNPVTTVVTTAPTAAELTYGQKLSESTLTGGVAVSHGSSVAGNFAWKEPDLVPNASDSGEYDVEFTPKDTNYGKSTCKVMIKVNKKTVSATDLEDAQKPVARTGDDVVYTGDPIELVKAPTTDLPLDYEAYYSTDNGKTWSTDIPKKTDPGTYTVNVKYVSKGGNCNDITFEDITVTITPADKKALNDAIAAAKACYDTIKDNADYKEVADKLDTAIKAAEKVAAKDKVTKAEVSTATEAVNKAKAAAEKVAFEAEKEAQKKASDALAAEGDSDVSKKLIEDAKKAIDALAYDETKSLDENKKAVAAILTKLKSDLTTQRAADKKEADDTAAAKKVTDAINALPASDKVATTDKAAIEAARKAYDALTADQKKKVPADVLKKLTDAEKALAAAEAAEKAAKELEAAKKEAQAAMNEQVTVKQKGKKFTVKWKKSSAADGYYVYAQYCGKKITKPAKTIAKNTTTKTTITKINGKKINQKRQFRVYVVPYKIIDGKKVKLAKSTVAHLVGSKSTKYSNVKKLTLKKTKYTVKVGKTAKIKAKITLVNKNRKHIPKGHGAKFRYKSSDTSIATVDKNGKIKGIKKGKCTIYVYSINGLTKKAKITVK